MAILKGGGGGGLSLKASSHLKISNHICKTGEYLEFSSCFIAMDSIFK